MNVQTNSNSNIDHHFLGWLFQMFNFLMSIECFTETTEQKQTLNMYECLGVKLIYDELNMSTRIINVSFRYFLIDWRIPLTFQNSSN